MAAVTVASRLGSVRAPWPSWTKALGSSAPAETMPAGSVVLEAAADQGDAVGEEGGGDGVAAVGVDGASVEGELEGRVAVDAAAAVEAEGLAHDELP